MGKALIGNFKGPKGDKGDKGDTGATGAQGPRGEKGDTGGQGPQGVQGVTGPQGPKGATGAQGAQGPKGDTGATGPQGPKGDKGDTGATGPAGNINTSVATFAQTEVRENINSGDTGSTIFGKIKKWFADIKGAAFCDVANDLVTTVANKVLDARQGKALDDKIAELNRNIQPHVVDAWLSNAITYTDSGAGLGATFPCHAFAQKIAGNFYRIDIKIYVNVTAVPDNYFYYGISSNNICRALFNGTPKSESGGQCIIYNPEGTLDNVLNGYGAYLYVPQPSVLRVGRYYTANGDSGAWTLNSLIGKFIYGYFFVSI